MEKKTERLATSLKFRKRCYSLLEQRAKDCIHCPVQPGWGSRRQHAQGSTEWNTSLPLNTPKRKPVLSNFSISHSLYLRSSQCRIFPYQWEPLSSTYPGSSIHILLHVNGAPWSCAVHRPCTGALPGLQTVLILPLLAEAPLPTLRTEGPLVGHSSIGLMYISSGKLSWKYAPLLLRREVGVSFEPLRHCQMDPEPCW